jgi:Proteasome assembly chaperone 4
MGRALFLFVSTETEAPSLGAVLAAVPSTLSGAGGSATSQLLCEEGAYEDDEAAALASLLTRRAGKLVLLSWNIPAGKLEAEDTLLIKQELLKLVLTAAA